MIGDKILEFEDLKKLLGLHRAADVERHLDRLGIRHFAGRAGVWTTIDLVNAAGGLKGASNDGFSAEDAA